MGCTVLLLLYIVAYIIYIYIIYFLFYSTVFSHTFDEGEKTIIILVKGVIFLGVHNYRKKTLEVKCMKRGPWGIHKFILTGKNSSCRYNFAYGASLFQTRVCAKIGTNNFLSILLRNFSLTFLYIFIFFLATMWRNLKYIFFENPNLTVHILLKYMYNCKPLETSYYNIKHKICF